MKASAVAAGRSTATGMDVAAMNADSPLVVPDIIYEVTLTLPAPLAAEYDDWLAGHIAEMLRMPGFIDADLSRAAGADAGEVTRVVRYRVSDREALADYLDHRAAAMRAAGIARFGERVSASRRVLEPAQAVATCDDCGAVRTARYCTVCGMDSRTKVVSLRALVQDFADDVLNFDSRLAHSLAPLLWRPGFLTNEYLAGRRARYIKPLRLYLFISVAFFFLLSVASISTDWFSPPAGVAQSMAQLKLSPEHAARLAEKPAWIQRIVHHVLAYKSNPQTFFTDMIGKLPGMMFVLLPLFALFLKLLYIRRRRYYVEHLIFSFHFHAVIFIAAIAFLAAYALTEHFGLSAVNDKLAFWLWLYLTLYLIMAMRKVYRQGWIKTLLKWSMLACCYGLALVVAFTTTMAWVLIE